MKNDMSSNAKLSFLERFGYGVGDYAANLVYSAISAFLLVYYTNVIGASAAAAASVIAVSKIFDGVSDLIMGYIVDHTDTKYGKARPWIARLCVPLAVCTVLMFSVPASFAGKAQIAYMFLTYNLVSTIFYTGVNVPYATLHGLMTTNQYERGLLGNFRNLLSTAGTMTINTVVLKMTGFFGGGDLDKHYDKKDFKNWELYTHVLTDDTETDLKKLPSAKGIWAPCLTYCGDEDLFYVIYGVMNSMNARYFDVDNYLITAKDIKGPWSEPVYIHSSGFDASILHDDDGRKYIVSLEWETREGYEKPGSICMVEYSPKDKEIVGYPRHIWSGGTDRGCIEAPHLTKHGGFYYIMCAEGGTGYNHCVTMGRSANVWGPYEKDPSNPIVTSAPGESFERHDPDHLKLKYFNPESPLQKCGHGSYVETQLGEVYLLHLCARPFVPELRCTLGRETAIQKMEWTKDGWLHMYGGGNLAREYVEESRLPECKCPGIPDFDDFDSGKLGPQYYAPRIMPHRFADVKARPGYVRIRGQESRTSLNKVSILARKLTSVYATVTTKMEFLPEIHQHSAGLIMYYDNMNYINLRKYRSETLGQSALSIIHLENGRKHELLNTRIPVDDVPVYLRLNIEGRRSWFEWSYDGKKYQKIGENFDTTKFSDEYCMYGEFTGTFVGLTCADRVKHRHYADFNFFEYKDDMLD